MGAHLLLPFSTAPRYPDWLHTGFIFPVLRAVYFSASKTAISTLPWDGEARGHRRCCLLFPDSKSPSAHPAEPVSATRVTFATTDEAGQKQLRLLSPVPLKNWSPPPAPHPWQAPIQAHIEICGTITLLLSNRTLCFWMAREAAGQWFPNLIAHWNPTVQGHSLNKGRVHASLSHSPHPYTGAGRSTTHLDLSSCSSPSEHGGFCHEITIVYEMVLSP